MSYSNISRSWNEYPVIENIIGKINQLKYRRVCLDLRQNVQSMHRKMFFLSLLSILFLFIVFLYSFGNSSNEKVSADYLRQQREQKYKLRNADNVDESIIFSKFANLNQTRKPSENVIIFLVASYTGDPRLTYNPYPKLREKILQLDERFADNYSTDIIIFHTGYPSRGELIPIIEGSRREIIFVNVDHVFYKFSPGFDPHIRDPTWSQRGKWHYHHMCYFWFKNVFELKIMQRYRYMMRLDDDSQILGKWPNIFDIMAKQQAVYMINRKEADNEYILPGLTLVRNLTAAFIAKNKITVQNPVMLAISFNHTVEVPTFWTHFEVVDISFMQRDDVLDYIDAVDESTGIFLYRWSDAALRYITLALFSNESQILYREKLGLIYCHPC